jgi:hypothetical protein
MHNLHSVKSFICLVFVCSSPTPHPNSDCSFFSCWVCKFGNVRMTSLCLVTWEIRRFGEQCKNTPWTESANELYRPSDCRLSAKLVPTFANKGWHVFSVTDPHSRILGFLDRGYSVLFHYSSQSFSKLSFTCDENIMNCSWHSCRNSHKSSLKVLCLHVNWSGSTVNHRIQ